MAGDPGGRPLLPQTTQMRTFSFAPPNFGPRENQKNYVFVDEHNRHKRLKGKRRKIKCDAATTNSWPCSACIRLKLQCVPPTVVYEKDYTAHPPTSDIERVVDLETSSGSGDDDSQHRPSISQQLSSGSEHPGYPDQLPYGDDPRLYQTAQYLEQADLPPGIPYAGVDVSRMGFQEVPYQPQAMFPTPPGPTLPSSQASDAWSGERYGSGDLSEALGELKIDESGLAPYISHQKRSLAEAPALEEYEMNLPTLPSSPGDTVKIPSEFMPTDEQASEYFEFFFENIHPYIPVINRPLFYQQWRTRKDTISPLLLEAIFACTGRMSADASEGIKWLALAGKHADSFMDVPRLSTLQALLLLLKARESTPKRGYYYRSWMTIVNLIAMAKDLGLDQHYELHQAGEPCSSSYSDCVTGTRVWQTLFGLETMIGGPQGRFDFAIDPETVDMSVTIPARGIADPEVQTSRQFTYLVRAIHNVRRIISIYGRIRKRKDWGHDPELVQMNPIFAAWIDELPQDLQVVYPADGSPPWLRSHFVGNLHSYYNLSVIMLHRPQLASPGARPTDQSWKDEMLLCYSAAKNLCKLQEAILRDYGMHGLLFMLRGINFTIYAVLTCTMLHLVALTSPDPEIYCDAKDFFTRHMRILEQCTTSWPMPDMRTQIDALRVAFSADVTKPFSLKPSFPYGSPTGPVATNPLPAGVPYSGHPTANVHTTMAPSGQSYISHPITPPISTADVGHAGEGESPAVQSLVMMASGQRHPSQQTPITNAPMQMVEPVGWNPSRVFDQWNTAFGTTSPNAAAPSHSSPSLSVSSTSGIEYPTIPSVIPQAMGPSGMSPTRQDQTAMVPPVNYAAAGPAFISPSQWQDSIASLYEAGYATKRRWDASVDGIEQASKRSR
ncbi:hypothetical protein L228DRAFT_264472 [Xylona heveae TC161]|uniref:Xylanolytic transcriptional activator regulatory domain-containing protein n=1 Tax=Xylona heveae (strain CBS 132557 / TC161) TaxID=1328760 RepID=A0A165JC60_XYLHT|nr:hypothetical protein L228DRAFT_264472 [Xylona heveae TC161]KZF26040.1 hypothetical protein L228DRAFT_264472 [Xylona heveae TC161]